MIPFQSHRRMQEAVAAATHGSTSSSSRLLVGRNGHSLSSVSWRQRCQGTNSCPIRDSPNTMSMPETALLTLAAGAPPATTTTIRGHEVRIPCTRIRRNHGWRGTKQNPRSREIWLGQTCTHQTQFPDTAVSPRAPRGADAGSMFNSHTTLPGHRDGFPPKGQARTPFIHPPVPRVETRTSTIPSLCFPLSTTTHKRKKIMPVQFLFCGTVPRCIPVFYKTLKQL